ncbi:hypothetical protein E2562_008110 [Oryza meyeriana var. granulata]|uniref:Uncharacterized protein n=1 Tax=Oryza meyeriana var. granulata TaxID=110450 RepID=A0A6G1CE95_9ORYZ|nr:hypothetical protein E2562_008110 [Oryza meyeriana var. granulata]
MAKCPSLCRSRLHRNGARPESRLLCSPLTPLAALRGPRQGEAVRVFATCGALAAGRCFRRA